MDYKITLLPGDGIGPEVTDGAVAVLNAVERKFGHDFHLRPMPIGGSAIDRTGVPLPEETAEACRQSDAVLIGAIGGPKWDDLKPHLRPERGLLALRSALGAHAGLCPVVADRSVAVATTLRNDVIKAGVNIMLVRDIAGGIYLGQKGYRDGQYGQEAFDTEVYSINEVERLARMAFEIAAARRKKVTCVDKSDLLTSNRLFQATVERIAKNYPQVSYNHMLVGRAINTIMQSPSEFDVIITTNLFGDILCSALSGVFGSIGMLPTAAIGGKTGIFGPAHGAAPELAGKDVANPIGAILSAAMMLATALELNTEAAAIEASVKRTVAKGHVTADISCGRKAFPCSKVAEEIALGILNA